MLKNWSVIEEIKHDKLCNDKCPYKGKKVIVMGKKKEQEEKGFMIRVTLGNRKHLHWAMKSWYDLCIQQGEKAIQGARIAVAPSEKSKTQEYLQGSSNAMHLSILQMGA